MSSRKVYGSWRTRNLEAVPQFKISTKGSPLNMHEKDLYPAVEKFLKTQKNCLSEYVWTELSLKRGKTRLRADVF
jgi:hypothetical protein